MDLKSKIQEIGHDTASLECRMDTATTELKGHKQSLEKPQQLDSASPPSPLPPSFFFFFFLPHHKIFRMVWLMCYLQSCTILSLSFFGCVRYIPFLVWFCCYCIFLDLLECLQITPWGGGGCTPDSQSGASGSTSPSFSFSLARPEHHQLLWILNVSFSNADGTVLFFQDPCVFLMILWHLLYIVFLSLIHRW